MVRSTLLTALVVSTRLSYAGCPFADGGARLAARDSQGNGGSRGHMEQFDVDDNEGSVLTSEVGGPIEDQTSLKVGVRGPTLMADFILRQKITHFDHERIPERVVHARGAGAYGTFTSYGDFSNITAASFLSGADKKTPVFVRFSTASGSRGSPDTARDVHGFATRFYTDEGNFDLVGSNIPVFYIQDAIQFPDLMHAIKPRPDSEVHQATTAHESAWDYFAQQPSTLHTLFWTMSGYGIPRSYRHMDGFGVHSYRIVTDDGSSRFVKWHFKSKQGKASLFWDEAQHMAGKNPDFHRQDLFDAIAAGSYPEWELSVQIFTEEESLAFGVDAFDPTKIIPEELVPLHPLGVLRLDANPSNYFAETEQISFQPNHIVRGIDFSEDPVLQGRLFSYLDSQLNRHRGPNFDQLPINRPLAPVHTNNRDGAGQHYIHKNIAAYTPNTLNKGWPGQANQSQSNGFFTTRHGATGTYVRKRSDTFDDHWTQPRLFYNSMTPSEQQYMINAFRYEISHATPQAQQKVIDELVKINHNLASRVAMALTVKVGPPKSDYYHSNKTASIGIYGKKINTIAGLRVGVLTSIKDKSSVDQAQDIKSAFAEDKVKVVIIGEAVGNGVDQTYSAADATSFDGIIVADGSQKLFGKEKKLTLFPNSRPAQIITDGYNWGKPLGFLGASKDVIPATGATQGPGVYIASSVKTVVTQFRTGLAYFKFLDRFPEDI